jgi:hypothetical protein
VPRRRLSYANVIATLALFVALGGTSYAAIKITGKDVQNGSLTGADIKKHSVQLNRLRGRLTQGAQGAKGDTGARGPKGDAGAPGTSATVDGVAAGGDLAGTYPDPTLKAGAVGPGALSPDLQQRFQLNVTNRAATSFVGGPVVDGVQVSMACTSGGERLDLRNGSGSAGSVGVEYVFGGGSAVHGQAFIANADEFSGVVSTQTANENGTGEALFWSNDGRVWAIDFNYDATSDYCSLQGVLRRG